MFTTKAFAVPHLKMIVCGIGAGGFLGKWFVQINDQMIVKGIDNLDFHTPKILSELWSSHKEKFSESQTTTVYHFGFSEEDGFVHTYAYRSTGNFKSEALGYGMGITPECTLLRKDVVLADIKKMMDEQRIIQTSKPKDERIFIGGEVQIHTSLKTE